MGDSIPEAKPEQLATTEAIGNVTYWRVTVGPRSGDLKFNISPFVPNFATATPWVIIVQSRQRDNADNNWPDQFAIQVNQTTQSSILVTIKRLDKPGIGWGQNLGLDLIVRE